MLVINRLIGSIVVVGSVWFAGSALYPSVIALHIPPGIDIALLAFCLMSAYAGLRLIKR